MGNRTRNFVKVKSNENSHDFVTTEHNRNAEYIKARPLPQYQVAFDAAYKHFPFNTFESYKCESSYHPEIHPTIHHHRKEIWSYQRHFSNAEKKVQNKNTGNSSGVSRLRRKIINCAKNGILDNRELVYTDPNEIEMIQGISSKNIQYHRTNVKNNQKIGLIKQTKKNSSF